MQILNFASRTVPVFLLSRFIRHLRSVIAHENQFRHSKKNVSKECFTVNTAKEKNESLQRTWKMIDVFVSSFRLSVSFNMLISSDSSTALFSGWSSIKHITQTHTQARTGREEKSWEIHWKRRNQLKIINYLALIPTNRIFFFLLKRNLPLFTDNLFLRFRLLSTSENFFRLNMSTFDAEFVFGVRNILRTLEMENNR